MKKPTIAELDAKFLQIDKLLKSYNSTLYRQGAKIEKSYEQIARMVHVGDKAHAEKLVQLENIAQAMGVLSILLSNAQGQQGISANGEDSADV